MARIVAPALWVPAGNLSLEPNAVLAAKEASRSVAMTAGPGAGKTEMLAQRADFLLRTGTCRYPQRILAIAFKRDAARNLKDRVQQRCGPSLSARLDSHTFHAFARRLIDRFRPVLVGRDALDADFTIGKSRIQNKQITFDDMVPLAVEIIKTSEVARNAVRQTYSHVFLDEFQDCTEAQYELILECFLDTGIPITAVGDYKQRIMVWAGALEGIFQTFATDFHAVPLNLYQNFRAQPLLRRMQNAMVKVMDAKAAVPDADLAGVGGSVSVGNFTDASHEAGAVADLIAKWLAEGVAASEIAVLIAKLPEAYSEELVSELERRAIPYKNEQSFKELDSEPAAELICDFLRVVYGEQQADAYERLMVELLQGVGDEAALHAARGGWNRFIEQSRAATRGVQAKPIVDTVLEMAQEFVDQVGEAALSRLSAEYEHGGRLQEVIDYTYLRLGDLLENDPNPMAALRLFADDNAVRIMTIHKCKGLEFDSVVILGVEEEAYWGKLMEERSAFFVGISRAKSRLVLTTCDSRKRPQVPVNRWDVQRHPHQEFLSYGINAK